MLILANNLKANVQDATRSRTDEPQRPPEPTEHVPRRRGRSPRPFPHSFFLVVVVNSIHQTQADSKTALARLKGPKFFLQFQIARVRTAQGARLSAAETVEHQLGKVTKVCLLGHVEAGFPNDGAERWGCERRRDCAGQQTGSSALNATVVCGLEALFVIASSLKPLCILLRWRRYQSSRRWGEICLNLRT